MMPDSSQAGPSEVSYAHTPPKRTAYASLSSITPFYLGFGPTAVTRDGRFLLTAIDTEVICTDLSKGTGEVVGKLEPVSLQLCQLSLSLCVAIG